MSDAPVELIVAAFQDESGAEQALQDLKAAKKEGLIRIENTAILRKDVNGRIHIKEAKDMGGGKGAVFGGVVGGIVGLIAGPAALVTGAIGAVVGGLAAKLSDGGFRDDRLQQVAASLKPGSSAIVALIEHEWVEELEAIMREEGANTLTAKISADIAKQMEEGGQVAYSLTDTGEAVNFSRVAASETKIEAGSLTMSEAGIERERLVATEQGVMMDALVVTDAGAAYEAVAADETGAVLVQAASDGAEGMAAVAMLTGEEASGGAAEEGETSAEATAEPTAETAKDSTV